ncbi:MAG TPA: SIS domain-containing protein [Rhodothermia bacterium]
MTDNQTIERLSRRHVERLCDVLTSLPFQDLSTAAGMLIDAAHHRTTVFVAGNGGSASTASHMACDLAKSAQYGGGQGLRIVSLADNAALMTALGNDESFDEIFSRQLGMLGSEGDLLILISGSGRSPNCILAAERARTMGMKTIALLGMGGGPVAKLADVSIVVGSDDYGIIEDAHLAVNHIITECLRFASTGPASDGV